MTCSLESKIFASRGCKQGEAAVQSICTRRSPCHIVFTSQNCCTYAPLHHVVMLEMDCVEQLSVNETWCLETFTGQKCFVGGQECQDTRHQNIFPPCQQSSRIISLTKGDLLLQVQDLWCFMCICLVLIYIDMILLLFDTYMCLGLAMSCFFASL